MSEQNMLDVAIIGMAGRFPKAKNVAEFWDNLKAGKESITFFSDEELRASGVSEKNIKDASYVKAHGVIEDVEMFDASFFNITPREAELTDPQQRIFLECCWEALEDAGHVPEKYEGIIGVYGGVSSNTYLLNNLAKSDALDNAGMYPIMIGNEKDFLCTRVAYKLNLKGPSATVQTACSTSLVAVHMACQSILNGECDMAIAGGATVRVPQKAGYYYQDGGILSPDGHCRAFDESAKGTVLGNGAGVVILKSLENAIQDNDHIYAVIKGTAVNNDGSMKVGFTAPSVEGQSKAIMEALAVAEVPPSSIGYIETHGTGTQLGDPIEIAALKKVFKLENRKNTCPIGSVKTNIGHLDVASGVVGLMKTALALENKVIPPSINFNQANPKLNIENSPFYVNTELKEWKTSGNFRRAGISSFGLGGTNAHVVLEENSRLKENNILPDGQEPYRLITMSARTAYSLAQTKKNMICHLEKHPNITLKDIAYTLAVGRREFGHKFYCVCKNIEDFCKKISKKELFNGKEQIFDEEKKQIIFLFSEILGVEKAAVREIYENVPVFKKNLDRCMSYIQSQFGIHLESFLLDTKFEHTNEHQIFVQFSLQFAIASFFQQMGVHVDLYAGNSVGQIVASCIEGNLNPEEALAVLYMQQTPVCQLKEESRYKVLEKGEEQSFLEVYLKTHQAENVTVISIGDILKNALFSAVTSNQNNFYALGGKNAEHSFYEQLLAILGDFWGRGYAINWRALYEDTCCKRISLPTYVFDRKKYWIDKTVLPQERSFQQIAASVAENINSKNSALNFESVAYQLKEVISKLIGVDEIEADEDLYELCGDSFEALQLNNEIEKQFGLKLPVKNIIENNTLEKLSDYIWKQLSDFHGTRPVHDDMLVKFRTQGDKAPIFLIHPAGGTVMGYKALVKYIPVNYPVYGIQCVQETEKDTIKTIEDISQNYISLIQMVQPTGPVILAGHSFGGNAAFEIAVRLQKIGRTVEHLIMFDSHPPLAYYSNKVFDESLFLNAFPRVCAMYFDKRVETLHIELDGLESVIRYLKSNGWIPWGFDHCQFENYYNIWRSNHNSLRTHMPKDKYNGNFVFFRAKVMQPKEIIEELNINLKEGMDIEEWSKLSTDKIKFFETPGTHYTMLNEPNVKTIAKELSEILK